MFMFHELLKEKDSRHKNTNNQFKNGGKVAQIKLNKSINK